MNEQQKQTQYPEFLMTDFQFHRTQHRQPKSLFKKVVSGERMYFKALKLTMKDSSIKVILFSPTGSEYITENGQTLKLLLPQTSPVKPGPDVVEQAVSHKKKKRERQWQKLEKFLG